MRRSIYCRLQSHHRPHTSRLASSRLLNLALFRSQSNRDQIAFAIRASLETRLGEQ
jgi:hypothetical protein